jgi:hypothetical protein
MLESMLVGVIVLVAALYAVWAMLPAPTRRRFVLKVAQALGGPTAPGAAGKVAGQLQKVAQARAGGCSDCPAATLTPAERASRQAPDDRR